jgi:hypothetical protein
MALFIPSKIKVGFQKREGTFTGKLAYIIYFDEKGVLRKEVSWEQWRDKNIESVEFDNTPRNGYLFNKGLRRDGYHWGSGRSVIRVYDPRDFEFEVSVDNLIGILMHSDVSKRDIVEECVFAWEGTELVLLPVNSEIYQESLKYTEKQSEKISAKELVKGYRYNRKKSDEILTYIGYYEWFDWNHDNYYGEGGRTHKTSGKKKHVFYDGTNFVTPGIATFSSVVSEEIAEDYAALVEKFFGTDNSQAIVGYKIVEPVPSTEKYYSTQHFSKVAEDGTVEKVQWCGYSDTFDITNTLSNHHINHYVHKSENEITTITGVKKPSPRSDFMSILHRSTPVSEPFRDKMVAKAMKLGYNPRRITKEQCAALFWSEGFGHLVFVLKNGNLVKGNR